MLEPQYNRIKTETAYLQNEIVILTGVVELKLVVLNLCSRTSGLRGFVSALEIDEIKQWNLMKLW